MKKVAVIFAALLMLLPLVVSAQSIVDDGFESLGEWVPGHGEWGIRGGMLIQRDTRTGLARIDRQVPQEGEIEISFQVRYEAGGFRDENALRNQQLHGGFGIHVGVDNAPLRRVAWGAGESYLLWLNLDTRQETRANAPEHFGFRGQVYESTSHTVMNVTPWNVDIQAELAEAGINLSIEDLDQFIGTLVPIRIRVNYNSGRIMVNDPTAPTIWFYFDVEPAVLRGGYMSLRTNSLALSFSDFRVTRR
jgi:hypothetical protein